MKKYSLIVVLGLMMTSSSLLGQISSARGSWSPLGTGVDREVFAMTVYKDKLIVGGNFKTVGGVAANGIAAWDGKTWSSLGSEFTRPSAMVVYDDRLIVPGVFYTEGELAHYKLQAWDGNEWTTMDIGARGLKFAHVNYLAAGGDRLVMFAEIKNMGVSGDKLVMWDGHSLSYSSVDGDFDALAVYGDRVIVARESGLSKHQNKDMAYLSAWDGRDFSPIGSELDGRVLSMVVFDDQLIVSGYFTTAGGVAANGIAAWDGKTWSSLGSEFSGRVDCMAVHDDRLFAGGYCTTDGNIGCHISVWDGNRWSRLDSGLDERKYWAKYKSHCTSMFTVDSGNPDFVQPGSVTALTVYKGRLIVGGWFTSAGGVPCNRIAVWQD